MLSFAKSGYGEGMERMEDKQVTIEKIKKVKINGRYKDCYQPVASLNCLTNYGRNGCDPTVCNFVFESDMDVIGGDRILIGEAVYDAKRIIVDADTKKLKVESEINRFETDLKAIAKLGCVEVKYGDVERPMRRDEEAERFMDAWIGTYAVNIAEHYHEIKNGKDISAFRGIFNRDVPAACVGAGPSLDKNAHLLHDFPGIIICADRAYKMLLARGVEPDFVVSVDCHYDLVAEMLDHPWNHRHRLILNTAADPKICKIWKGDIYWFLMRHPGVQFMDKILPALFPKFEGLENVGCVGNTSVIFSAHMGAGPSVLVGQDYGYTGGKMHAKRFNFDENGNALDEIKDDHAKMLKERTGKVSVNGVTTYLPFKGYLRALYAIAKIRGITIVNCTEGGIITNLPRAPLSKVIKEMDSGGDSVLRAKQKIKDFG